MNCIFVLIRYHFDRHMLLYEVSYILLFEFTKYFSISALKIIRIYQKYDSFLSYAVGAVHTLSLLMLFLPKSFQNSYARGMIQVLIKVKKHRLKFVYRRVAKISNRLVLEWDILSPMKPLENMNMANF